MTYYNIYIYIYIYILYILICIYKLIPRPPPPTFKTGSTPCKRWMPSLRHLQCRLETGLVKLTYAWKLGAFTAKPC